MHTNVRINMHTASYRNACFNMHASSLYASALYGMFVINVQCMFVINKWSTFVINVYVCNKYVVYVCSK